MRNAERLASYLIHILDAIERIDRYTNPNPATPANKPSTHATQAPNPLSGWGAAMLDG